MRRITPPRTMSLYKPLYKPCCLLPWSFIHWPSDLLCAHSMTMYSSNADTSIHLIDSWSIVLGFGFNISLLHLAPTKHPPCTSHTPGASAGPVLQNPLGQAFEGAHHGGFVALGAGLHVGCLRFSRKVSGVFVLVGGGSLTLIHRLILSWGGGFMLFFMYWITWCTRESIGGADILEQPGAR